MKNTYRILPLLLVLCLLLSTGALGTEAPAAYRDRFPAELPTARVTASAGEAEKDLAGLSLLIYGDSLTSGYGLTDPGSSWASLLGTACGMQVTNISVSGSTLARHGEVGRYGPGGCYAPYVDRSLPEGDFDLVLVEGGGNDWYCAVPVDLADLDSRDPGTFTGAVNCIIDRLEARYPAAQILFMTSWQPGYYSWPGTEYAPESRYYEAMSRVCRKRGVACLEARDPAVSGIRPLDDSFRRTYFLSETDPWHLNTRGQALFLPTIAGWLAEQAGVRGFRDVGQRSWYAAAVRSAVDRGLMLGLERRLFGPEGTVSRGMLATVLYRAAGRPPVTADMPFLDVAPGRYYHDAVAWAWEKGIVKGVAPDRFDPEGILTREQLAAILYRLAGATGSPEGLEAYTDGNRVSGWAGDAMGWAVETGLLRGYENGRLYPQGHSTRAQLAAVLTRYLDLYPSNS